MLSRLIVSFSLALAPANAFADDPAPPDATQPQTESAALRLNLKRAVEIALAPEGNFRVALAVESVRLAQSRSAQSRAALLPNIETSVAEQSLTRNLEAFGIRFNVPIPGFTSPTFVGPFNVFDARATLTQSLFDLSAIRRFQSSRAGVSTARADSESSQDQVRRLVARAYLSAVRADAALDTARANVRLAEALLELAKDRKTAGTSTGIEVTRARVQLANETQRLLVSENERRAAHLRLVEALGLKMDVALELTDPLAYQTADIHGPEQALQIALESRADWKAQREREESQRLLHSSVEMERLPSVLAFADYGTIGTNIHHALPTRTYGVMVRIPVFDGGRRDARRTESDSQYRQERIRSAELRRQIDLDIRLALDALHSAAAQIKTAEEGLALAESELAQAQRRYQAGMTSNIEITDAQTRLQRARENRITALFNHNLARIELAAAMGTIRKITE